MTEKPILLFLHGVGEGDPGQKWKTALEKTLAAIGYPALEDVVVLAPFYADALQGTGDNVGLPRITLKKLSREEARENRRNYDRRIAAMENRLAHHVSGKGGFAPQAVVDLAFSLQPFIAANNYLKNNGIRAQVLTQILDLLPESGKILIIGHSLGSVIAADLLRRLPVGIEVTGLVTMGSPLASSNCDVDSLRSELKEPPGNLAWWVNMWSPTDPVAALRGVSSVFTWVLDQRIKTRVTPLAAHQSSEYLASETLAHAIGYGLYGSLSRELVRMERHLDTTMDEVERTGIRALRYAHLISRELEKGTARRYVGALREVQYQLIRDLKAHSLKQGGTMATTVADLDFDYDDLHTPLPVPPPISCVGKEEAMAQLIALATENLIHPFEIEVDEKTRIKAMQELTKEMGFGTRFGEDVFAALREAGDVLAGTKRPALIKWGALGAGALALVVATGGLALAAAPGVAGAALVTSALASFGPGGMIGGLLTAGTLVSAGGGSIVAGLLAPGTSAESLRAVVEQQLAMVILRQRQDLEQDPEIWSALAESEQTLIRDVKRMVEFSDRHSPLLKETRGKLEMVRKALDYLSANKMEPGLLAETAEKSGPYLALPE